MLKSLEKLITRDVILILFASAKVGVKKGNQ